MRRRLLAFILLALPVGCGGGGGPTTATSTTVRVLDGATGAEVAGGPLAASPGDRVSVERAGYLRRDTIVPRDAIIRLWPVSVDEAYVRTLVYADSAARTRLVRWPTAMVTVTREMPAEVIEAVRPWVTLVPSDAPALNIAIDPRHAGFAQLPPDTIGLALRQIADADARILTVTLVFRSASALAEPGSLIHEVGHALGLDHSPRRQDLMFPSTLRTTTTFSADERILLTMMYAHRRPGQVAPDNDQALGQAATGRISP